MLDVIDEIHKRQLNGTSGMEEVRRPKKILESTVCLEEDGSADSQNVAESMKPRGLNEEQC